MTLEEMRVCVMRSQKLQETIFVPFIAAHVPVKKQEVFNRRVIQKLGLLESQVSYIFGYKKWIISLLFLGGSVPADVAVRSASTTFMANFPLIPTSI